MAPRSRILSPVALLLANAIIIYLVLFRWRRVPCAPDDLVWLVDSDRKFYVVDSEWAGSQEILSKASSIKDLPVPKEEVVSKVADLVLKSNSALMEKIESELRQKHSASLVESIRKQINAELREQKSQMVFYNMERSYDILDDMRAQYLKHNEERLRNFIAADFLKDTTDEQLKRRVSEVDALGVDRQRYFSHVMRGILGENEPFGLGVEDKGEGVMGLSANNPSASVLSEENLTENRVRLVITDFIDLQDKHQAVVTALRELAVPPKEIYSGDGIVIAARKRDMVGALNVIVQVREEGSELPVEVVLNSNQDFDAHFCEKLLPKLNARCVIAENEMGTENYAYLTQKGDGFRMKALALMVSSFDNTVLLDADNFPIKNVDTLLTSAPYLESRCLLWPDLWHRTTSPKFYEIAGLSPGEPIRRSGISNNDSFAEYISRDKKKAVAFHDLAGIPSSTSVELGQMVISKREHFRGLFLALYYNLNGPHYYYHLLYQGTPGDGDRETFVPAFEVMNEPYSLTGWLPLNTGVERLKPHTSGTYFDESTLMQMDPTESARYVKSWRRWLLENGLDTRLDLNEDSKFTKELRYKFFVDNNKVRQPTGFFLHVHDPKINSLANELLQKTRYDYESRYLKNVNEHTYAMGTTDWELRFQAINEWSTCHAFTNALYWQSFGLEQSVMCQKSRDYVRKLTESSNDETAAQLKVTHAVTL